MFARLGVLFTQFVVGFCARLGNRHPHSWREDRDKKIEGLSKRFSDSLSQRPSPLVSFGDSKSLTELGVGMFPIPLPFLLSSHPHTNPADSCSPSNQFQITLSPFQCFQSKLQFKTSRPSAERRHRKRKGTMQKKKGEMREKKEEGDWKSEGIKKYLKYLSSTTLLLHLRQLNLRFHLTHDFKHLNSSKKFNFEFSTREKSYIK